MHLHAVERVMELLEAGIAFLVFIWTFQMAFSGPSSWSVGAHVVVLVVVGAFIAAGLPLSAGIVGGLLGFVLADLWRYAPLSRPATPITTPRRVPRTVTTPMSPDEFNEEYARIARGFIAIAPTVEAEPNPDRRQELQRINRIGVMSILKYPEVLAALTMDEVKALHDLANRWSSPSHVDRDS